ncbi:MAG: hypothetical protein RR434_01035 [Raoultibacter sp.]
MTQRNPMNDRYQSDEIKGQTRKSAASAKPKTKAASSVHVEELHPPKKKGLFSKAAAPAKSDGKKSSSSGSAGSSGGRVKSEYYNPPTAEYKRMRRIWWVLLVGAIAMTAASWALRSLLPSAETISMVTLVLAYAMIIGALYVDFSKIRKIRRAYQNEMESKKTKASKAEAKKLAAEEEEAAAARAAAAAAKKGEKNSILSRITGGKNKTASEQAEEVVDSTVEADAAAKPAATTPDKSEEKGK